MTRFGYLAVEKLGYVTKEQLSIAVEEQWKQEWERNGKADPLGKICLDMKLLTSKQLDTVLEAMLMEPNISWCEETRFVKHLRMNKSAKQAIGEYIGRRIAEEPSGITVFLSDSSTVYYAFRGMVKHGADVHVLTTHAAILAVYPSRKSKIRSVTTIWKGRVDLDNGLIEPLDLDDPNTGSQLGFLRGEVTHALIGATGFDSNYGPMVDNATAREVARQALKSETHTCILIDHTKVRVGTRKNDAALLFEKKEWYKIRSGGSVEVVVNCHPQMPREQRDLKFVLRGTAEIEDILRQEDASKSVIKDVKKYQAWSMSLRDILTEIPFGVPESGVEPELEETRERAPKLLKKGKRKPVPKLEEAEEGDPNLLVFEREVAEFKRMLPRLMKSHPNQFVAILNGKIVDHDEDELELTKRIYVDYPTDFVLIDEVRERAVSASWLESPEGEQ